MRQYFATIVTLLSLAVPLQAKTVSWSVNDRIQSIEKSVLSRIGSTVEKLAVGSKVSLVIFKKERVLEVWSQGKENRKLLSYPFTAFSGKLGPKNKQGDQQIPEGVYKLTALNPNSKFYLSMRVNYPNALDLKRAKASGIKDAGSDIYIHGKNKTVGCVPIGDQGIEDLFFIANKVGLRNMEVIISPARPPLPTLKILGLDEKNSLDKEKYGKIQQALKSINYPAEQRK